MFLGLCLIYSQKQHGCCFRSNAYKDVCRLRWRIYRKHLSESLEHLASYNEVICINITCYTQLSSQSMFWHLNHNRVILRYYFTASLTSVNSCISSAVSLTLVEKLLPSSVVILTSMIVPSFMTSFPDTARRNIGNLGWDALKRSQDDFN